MKKIKFTRRTVFETHGPNHPDNPIFEVDQEETLSNDQAERWLKRSRAVLIEDLGSDVDPVLAGADPAKVDELRDAVNREHDAEEQKLADDLDDAADDLRDKLDAEDDA